jgi:hypothetical protein
MPLLKSKIAAPVVEAPKQDAPTPAQVVHVAGVKKAVAKSASSETMSKADWASKDDRISRAGVWQACMHSVGLLQLNTGNTLEDYLALVEKAADTGYEYVHRA